MTTLFFIIILIVITIVLLTIGTLFPLVVKQLKEKDLSSNTEMYNEYHRKERKNNRIALLVVILIMLLSKDFFLSYYPDNIQLTISF